ncbi:SIMPL domain-containing protein [Paracoccus caeni]|uniref:SIMPL domain-containing protein n=1 Tax=Paracoccus caeni TaxID=657651 RepID=A0A934SJ34_9RHOB|nr:SIMPL domain-containing protein [Paracoccus caeni]MBK4216262.1 SIMPL domain-containing protein [Paracoccus caeni]
MRQSIGLVLAAIMLAIGIGLAGFFGSQTILNARTGANTAAVKGLSERLVESDKARWSLSYSRTERDPALVADTFANAEAITTRLRSILAEQGFEEAEIYVAPLVRNDFDERDNEGRVYDRYYNISGSLTVSTARPELIEPSRAAVLDLAREGIQISEDSLDYSFNKLNEIKPDMLREATENARIAADEFARNAGVTVGGIQSASQGGFEVNDAPGASPGSTQKLVRVVTNVSFYLEN